MGSSIVITLFDGATIETGAADNYQWNDNVGPISGETSQQFAPSAAGDYTVTITDINNCSAESSVYSFVNSVGISDLNTIHLEFYPNPTHDVVFFNYSVDCELLNIQGQVIKSETNASKLDLTGLTTGVYFLSVANGQLVKIVKN